jgi:hypothetical protein
MLAIATPISISLQIFSRPKRFLSSAFPAKHCYCTVSVTVLVSVNVPEVPVKVMV